MLYPNDIQTAILHDRPVDLLETLAREFVRSEGARSGARFHIPESKPGVFYRLYGGDDLMITLEYVDAPADAALFRPALTSPVTGLLCPDIRQRLMRNRSVILVNVSHGVIGSSPEAMRLLARLGQKPPGHSLPQFRQRLEVASTIARIACDIALPQAVHWTQSDQLIPGEKFDAYAAPAEAPTPLHIHPFLFGRTTDAGDQVGIRTFGARHFVGREIRIDPNSLPWSVNYDVILTFLRIASMANGYVIPDDDTFGPEDRSCSYRVTHLPASGDDVAFYVLRPLFHRDHRFVADDYVPPERAIDDRAPPLAVMPADDADKMDLVNEWREKRALAEGIGGRFEVRVKGSAPIPPKSPVRNWLRRQVSFGRKGV